jgi:Raf kinase inhibitor-like YbhB/YbcL family protein
MRHVFTAILLTAIAGTAGAQTLRPTGTPANLPQLQVTSQTFPNGGVQPRSTAFGACGGQNISPDLHWRNAPAGTKSFMVTEFDPDAPTGVGFWHWVVADIPAGSSGFDAGAALPAGAIAGMTDHGLSGYQGPCPPVGDHPHHYKITVSALDISRLPGMTVDSTGAFLASATRHHIIAQGFYFGTYAR